MIRPLFLSLLLVAPVASEAQQDNVPRIESSDCSYKADSLHKTHCSVLIVPENRHHPHGRTIKLPFIYVESNNPAKSSDPVLYTGSGPGVSSLHPLTSIARRSLLRDRDYIAFEQRGTHFAVPNLDCDSEGQAVQQAYIDHRSTDSAVLAAVRACREKLIKDGIDLSAYNTDERGADIEDLRRLLHIDSLNLLGISYSGGLMMAVLQKYPQHIRSLVLDSPLPEFVNIDEQELANFNEALTSVLGSSDSTLLTRFHNYFSGLGGKWGAMFIYSGRNAREFAVGKLLHTSWPGPQWLTGGMLGPGSEPTGVCGDCRALRTFRSGLPRRPYQPISSQAAHRITSQDVRRRLLVVNSRLAQHPCCTAIARGRRRAG
jgi:pimeloyl-ACP methyl ester carboxylesterase